MSRVPRIRFKGFEEDWEQRKLGEIYTQLIERNVELLPYKRIISVSTMKYKLDGNGAAETSLSNYKRLRLGDIAFEGHTSKEFRYGRFVLNDIGDGIMSPRFSALRPINNMPIEFWKYYIHYEPIMKHILVNSTKSGTMMNELVVEEFLNEKLLVPVKLEQQKIGRCLQYLDHLITLHQRKLEKLKIIKKSMLENLFPKNKEKTPRIRFSGFSEDWEQRKLINILSLLKDGTHGTHKDEMVGPLLLSAKNIKNGEVYYDETDRRISYNDFEKIHANFTLQLGDVLLTIVGSIGETALLRNPLGITFQRSVAFLRVTNKVMPEFLIAEINTNRFKNELENRKSTSAQPGIYLGDLGEIPVFMSRDLTEQQKIGTCFQSLDHLITLHQSKLEKLQKIKKSMLESMFV